MADHLAQHPAVGQDKGQSGAVTAFPFYRAFGGRVKQPEGVLDDSIEIQRLELKNLLFRKTNQLAD
jgi:hypothetical protein